MAIDETTKKQLLLLAAALKFAIEIDRKISPILAMLTFYGSDKKANKTILDGIATMTQANSARAPDVASAIITYMIPDSQWYPWETRGYFDRKLAHALQTAATKYDTSLANIVTKQMAASVKLAQRQAVFREANENVLEAAYTQSGYARKGLVIWRSRSQADGLCSHYNRKVMTVDEFRSIYPIHPNCMCTAELVPETMSDARIAKYRFKDTRPEHERVPNTPERMREKGDREQYERWKKEGVTLPSFERFRKLKYEPNNSALDGLKQDFRRQKVYNSDVAYMAKKFSSEDWGKTINPEMQAPHNYVTREVGKSYLNKDINAQQLLDKYAGTGEVEKRGTKRTRTNREIIDTGKPVGIDIHSGDTTTMIKIHHSKKRTHIVPYSKKGD